MNKLYKYILPLLSLAVIAASLIVFFQVQNTQIASHVGSYVSAVAAALAFLWLIATFLQQMNELKLQREELRLQRSTLDLQREEIRKISKYNALQQIARMLESFNESLEKKSLPNVHSADDLPKLYTEGWTTYWKPILENTDSNLILKASNEWHTIETVCLQFLSIIASAVNLYSESTGEFDPIPSEGVPLYVTSLHEQLRKIPHIQQYIDPAYAIAMDFSLMEPGIKKVRLARYEALDRLFPEVVKKDELQKLRDEVKQYEKNRYKANTEQVASEGASHH